MHAFVFNWKGHEAGAAALEEKIARHTRVTVINSEEGLDEAHPHWDHLDDSAYFSAQWNRAMELFDGDLLFHIQADARFDDFERLLAKIDHVFRTYPVGVYEPNVDFTDVTYQRAQLFEIEPDLLAVPMTDCTCWCVHGDVIRSFPRIDLSASRLGWGVVGAVAAVSQLRVGKYCVRDYGFLIDHPQGRGYSTTAALAEIRSYMLSLDPDVRARMRGIYGAWMTRRIPIDDWTAGLSLEQVRTLPGA